MKILTLLLILASLLIIPQKSFSQFDLLNEHKNLYSQNKVKTVKKFLVENGSKKLYTLTSVNKSGLITMKIFFNTENGNMLSQTLVTYPEKFQAIESYTFLPDSSTYRTDYTYNASGQLIKITYEDFISTFEFNPSENSIHHTFTQSTGETYNLFYIYNSDNLLEAYRYIEGETKYFYNSDKLLTHSKTFEQQGLSDESTFEYYVNRLTSKESTTFYVEEEVSLILNYEYTYEFYE